MEAVYTLIDAVVVVSAVICNRSWGMKETFVKQYAWQNIISYILIRTMHRNLGIPSNNLTDMRIDNFIIILLNFMYFYEYIL